MDTIIRKARQTAHKSKAKLVKEYPNVLPSSSEAACPNCSSVVYVNRVKVRNSVMAGWCDVCGMGVVQ